MKNSGKTRFKRTKIDYLMNYMVYTVFIFCFGRLLSFVLVFLYVFLMQRNFTSVGQVEKIHKAGRRDLLPFLRNATSPIGDSLWECESQL